jgi:DNA-directed RNA polymerase subunit K/omega
MSAVVVLEWTFSPPDYFEEPIEISCQAYTMTITDGQVQAKIDSALFEADPDMRQRLHDALNDRFLAVQLLTYRAYELSRSTKTRVHPDGRRDIFFEVEPGRIEISGGTLDIQIKDKDGNVVHDTKRDRIAKKKSLAELVSAHRPTDSLLASLLKSHDAAIRDPNNELVHLYEIRDALSAKFGGDTATRTALGITSTQWYRFGQLCNNEPLRQGRHRGKTGGVLRDATEAELAEARGIAQTMIEAYLRHIEDSTSPR